METSYFWDGNRNAGDVGDCGPYAASALAALLMVLSEDRTGVTSGLVCWPSTPAAASVKVSPGRAMVGGQLYTNTTELTLALEENAAGNPRLDSIVVETDWTAKTMRLKVLKGTPAVTPTAPALTQIAGVLWQEPLATVALADGYTTVVETDVTRTRRWARTDFPGQFLWCGGAPVAPGWLPCDGRVVSRTLYVDLFDAVGTTFGAGDGSTTFNLPDFRGRSPLGPDNLGGTPANRVTNTGADVIGGAGGSETVTLTEGQLPSHAHQFTARLTNGAQYSGASSTGNYGSVTGTSTTAATGGGQAHNNMHPWLAVPVYIRS